MIDRATVEKIKEAANIVDVVSEFVTLRRSGANYKGLCPFHNEKTPSFYVSPARGTCHCFGCGKGGSPVTFIMEHEQMTYPEALRWLANKYHIEIHERELTDHEREEQSLRESMFIINEWTANYFEDQLHSPANGDDIGMQYFRSRGFRDDVIRKFRLGYDLPNRFKLAQAAIGQGYKADFLVKTGICYQNEHGELIDRYAGRVTFPWIGVNGKVVGFTARVLDSRTKGVNQKYVNSPDSDLFHKDHELYGIFQAKKAIAREDRVYMVEGQADVIAMHQCGLENTVANSGTALSMHQIHMLHRFTSNITLIYDGDAAGIHAALRGTDMLLSEGMNLNVLLLPGGQDPDEFARSHTAADFRQYIDDHQVDFIQFKTDLMLRNERDPKKRADAINSIVESISVVPNQILRDTYIHDCSQRIGLNESTLINQMNNFIRNRQAGTTAQRQDHEPAGTQTQPNHGATPVVTPTPLQQASKVSMLIAQLVIRNGERIIMDDVEGEDGQHYSLTVAQYVFYNLTADHLSLGNELLDRVLSEAAEHCNDPSFVAEPYFINHEDINISKLATDLSMDRYHLSQPKTEGPDNEEAKLQALRNETEDLRGRAIHLLLDFRMDYVEAQLKKLQTEMKTLGNDMEKLKEHMERYRDMQHLRNQLARQLGSNIIA